MVNLKALNQLPKLKRQNNSQYIMIMYNKFWKELYIAAFRRLQSEENAEDILQDVFLSLLESDFDFENEQSVRALLHKRLKSRIIDFFRKEILKTSFENQKILQNDYDDTYSDTWLLSNELEFIVQQEINNLPEKMKEIFLLSREERLSNEEIATRLKVSGKTVRNQLSTALKKIRATIHKYNSVELNPSIVNIFITLSAVLFSNR
ncbi:RNA polymerase sigma-70 factor (ECF subfamily) [Albibacterium bauzanense]|uniref:RNA polymerase sigma-70 factor (ECF subfamily) n=2 Tax=Albibacterium bauzanense TaxID=653929 RepID=A0A4R1LRK0_9SPHI|nr:RNA polymerase sigma-70 factor (ECF subfamily) [Albibacterium bauzanense]